MGDSFLMPKESILASGRDAYECVKEVVEAGWLVFEGVCGPLDADSPVRTGHLDCLDYAVCECVCGCQGSGGLACSGDAVCVPV